MFKSVEDLLKFVGGAKAVAGRNLLLKHWVGSELMTDEFLESIENSEPDNVETLANSWFCDHRLQLASLFRERMTDYLPDELAKQAMTEAIQCYEQELYLSCVRTLLPEVERFGRQLIRKDGWQPRKQADVLELLTQYADSTPVHVDNTSIENQGAVTILTEILFASCWSVEDANKLPRIANRHAELHGLKSYGDLHSASVMLTVQDFLMRIGPNNHPLIRRRDYYHLLDDGWVEQTECPPDCLTTIELTEVDREIPGFCYSAEVLDKTADRLRLQTALEHHGLPPIVSTKCTDVKKALEI